MKSGGLAQMVERSLSMREVLGSMPRFSNPFAFHTVLFDIIDIASFFIRQNRLL